MPDLLISEAGFRYFILIFSILFYDCIQYFNQNHRTLFKLFFKFCLHIEILVFSIQWLRRHKMKLSKS